MISIAFGLTRHANGFVFDFYNYEKIDAFYTLVLGILFLTYGKYVYIIGDINYFIGKFVCEKSCINN